MASRYHSDQGLLPLDYLTPRLGCQDWCTAGHYVAHMTCLTAAPPLEVKRHPSNRRSPVPVVSVRAYPSLSQVWSALLYTSQLGNKKQELLQPLNNKKRGVVGLPSKIAADLIAMGLCPCARAIGVWQRTKGIALFRLKNNGGSTPRRLVQLTQKFVGVDLP